MELLIAIAALCSIPNGSVNRSYTEEIQLKCQKEYMKCIEKNEKPGEAYTINWYANQLIKCVKDK
jgi:hypothetical protein